MGKQRIRLLVILLLIGIFFLSIDSTQAQSPALVRIDPVELIIQMGEEGHASVIVEGVDDLYGLEFHLSYDPQLIEVLDANPDQENVQLEVGDFLKDSFVAVNKADSNVGRIDYAVTLLNPAPPVSGSGVIAIINFKAKNLGSSPIKVDQVILVSKEAVEIPSSSQEGKITVSEETAEQAAQASDADQQRATEQVEGQTQTGGEVGAENSPSAGSSELSNSLFLGAAACGGIAFLLGALVLLGAVMWKKRA